MFIVIALFTIIKCSKNLIEFLLGNFLVRYLSLIYNPLSHNNILPRKVTTLDYLFLIV